MRKFTRVIVIAQIQWLRNLLDQVCELELWMEASQNLPNHITTS